MKYFVSLAKYILANPPTSGRRGKLFHFFIYLYPIERKRLSKHQMPLSIQALDSSWHILQHLPETTRCALHLGPIQKKHHMLLNSTAISSNALLTVSLKLIHRCCLLIPLLSKQFIEPSQIGQVSRSQNGIPQG